MFSRFSRVMSPPAGLGRAGPGCLQKLMGWVGAKDVWEISRVGSSRPDPTGTGPRVFVLPANSSGFCVGGLTFSGRVAFVFCWVSCLFLLCMFVLFVWCVLNVRLLVVAIGYTCLCVLVG